MKNTMIPQDDNLLITAEEIERWPALGFYLGVLDHLAPGAVRTFRAPAGEENPCSDAWCVEIPRGSERWCVSVDQNVATPEDGRPAWRQPAVLNTLEALRENLAAAQKLHSAPAAVRSAWSLIVGHPTRPMSVAEVAAAVDLSAGHLGERFEEILGTSFRRAMRDERIAHSIKQLEKTDLRISEIAAALGGQSLSQYNRNFVAATGITPSQWRDRFSRTGHTMASQGSPAAEEFDESPENAEAISSNAD